MKAYILHSEKKIDPFGDHPKECLVGNKKLEDIQRYILKKINIDPIGIESISKINDPDEHLIIGDNVFFTEELLRKFISKSPPKMGNTVCALKKGTTTLKTIVVLQNVNKNCDHVEYDLHFITKKQFRSNKSIVIIDPDYLAEGIRLPNHFCGVDKYLVPVSSFLIAQINHWSILWAVNVAFALSDIARVYQLPKFKQLLLAIKSQSFNKWKILEKNKKIGMNCDIHPTAYIEGSTIGDNVSIGAGVIIRGSIIGDNVTLGNNVVIEASVLGHNSTILHGHVMFAIIYPNFFSVSQMISASIIGKNSFTGSGVTLTDYRFDRKNVTVIKDDIEVDTGNRLMGSCLGHGVYLGSGCIVGPGRSIPNGMRITPSKERILGSLENMQGFRIINNSKSMH